MYLTEELQKKWDPVLNHPELESIKDPYKKAVTALVLENQQQAMQQDARPYGLERSYCWWSNKRSRWCF